MEASPALTKRIAKSVFLKKKVIFTPKTSKSQLHFTNFNAIFVDFSQKWQFCNAGNYQAVT